MWFMAVCPQGWILKPRLHFQTTWPFVCFFFCSMARSLSVSLVQASASGDGQCCGARTHRWHRETPRARQWRRRFTRDKSSLKSRNTFETPSCFAHVWAYSLWLGFVLLCTLHSRRGRGRTLRRKTRGNVFYGKVQICSREQEPWTEMFQVRIRRC